MDFLFANIMIALSVLTLLAAVAVAAYSAAHSLRTNRRSGMENGVPTALIERCTVGLLLVVGLPSLLIGSLTDMCIILSITLLAAASALIAFGTLRSARRAAARKTRQA